MRRVHGEATECVVFIGRQRNAWEPTGWVRTECVVVFIGRALTEQAMETRPGVPQDGTPRDTVHLHRRPPPASTGYRRPPPASTGSCSSSLHHALLHRLLFNQPSTGSCSSSPNRLDRSGSCSSRGNATAHCSSTPPQRSVFIQSIGFS